MSTNPLFGRAYKLTVAFPGQNGADSTVIRITDSSFEPEALRMVFDVKTIFYQTAWYADIHIYNANEDLTSQVIGRGNQPVIPNSQIRQGMIATLEAGYQNGNFGAIWSGPVFQATFTREDAVTSRLSMYCLLWLVPLAQSPVNENYAAFTKQVTVIQSMVSRAFGSSVPLNVGPSISDNGLSRGKTVFGSVRKYLDNAAWYSNSQWFYDGKSVNLAKIDDNVPTEDIARTFGPPALPASQSVGQQPPPSQGIIVGTPEQTQYGVRFRALLDPTVKVQYPAQVVAINNSLIVQQKRTRGQFPGTLDQNGQYIVFAVRYIGDTRGEPWYIEIEGVTSVLGKLAMAQFLAEDASLNGN